MLLNEAAAVDFVRDAFGHLKAIGFTDASQPLLDKAAVVADTGVVKLDKIKNFIEHAQTRQWDREPNVRTLHYTPNRWLVLLVTLIVSARVVYGLYRSFEAASAGLSGHALVGAFGVPQSLAAGAIVIGYHLAYNVALRWRIGRWQRRALRPL